MCVSEFKRVSLDDLIVGNHYLIDNSVWRFDDMIFLGFIDYGHKKLYKFGSSYNDDAFFLNVPKSKLKVWVEISNDEQSSC